MTVHPEPPQSEAAPEPIVDAEGAPVSESAAAPSSPIEEGTARINGRVLYPALGISIALILPALIWPTRLREIVSAVNATVVNGIGWYYTLAVVAFVVFCAYIGFSRLGDVKLGQDDDEPEYSYRSWFAMLFAAGMGIGLVFWGVAEPLEHFVNPPPGTEATTDADLAQSAMTTTFLHWGLSAWSIYAVLGIAVAYAAHRKGRPMSMRWVLEPLLGDRVKGWMGDVIDVIAIVGTLFGVATSLGFGASQFSSGLDFLGLVKQSPTTLLIIVVVIALAATASVASGLDKGVKLLSNANLILAGVLLVIVLLVGQPLFVMNELVQNIGQYIQQFIPLSFRTLPYQGEAGTAWLGSWTTYYWGWWMSWSPFVGIFIARISKGRTAREFMAGVLLVPAAVTFLWFSVMGGNALYQQIFRGIDLTADDNWSTTALFSMLENLPGGPVLSGLFLLLLVVFFVTSSDSASFVLASMSTGGDQHPTFWVRVTWALFQGAVAAVLLWTGARHGHLTDGLGALQVLAILAAVPLSMVMLGACVATLRSFQGEYEKAQKAERRLVRREIKALAAETAQGVVADAAMGDHGDGMAGRRFRWGRRSANRGSGGGTGGDR